MNKPLLVGISGGIGAGKSIVSKIFHVLGAPVYDADSRAKDLMIESESLRSAISVLFGDESISNGQLNRKHIAAQAFYDPKLLSQLNQLVHPAVEMDFTKWISTQTFPYILKEAALLFETGSYKTLDKVILVSAPRDIRIKRVLERDLHRSEKDIKAIMNRQMSEAEKKELTDIYLTNDGTELLIPKVLELHEQFREGQ